MPRKPKAKATVLKLRVYPWICEVCAEKQGGDVPNGRLVSWKVDKCPYCKRNGALMLVETLNWKYTYYAGY